MAYVFVLIDVIPFWEVTDRSWKPTSQFKHRFFADKANYAAAKYPLKPFLLGLPSQWEAEGTDVAK
ncbi:hypothetical protein O4H53_24180 [Sulfitobacter sp. G21635-S1]|uniref:hypothetical protein n=1 Tax=Sulfitobacter sp. G21635-S1 TaxID=3014043 RepID=UPI0022AFF9C1|nr:hypothetical protein [Sulfitobacter sp. G21635-S1]MCZ4258651.1 hypothetical protein [Sulfitobacter sp. G21635-S1]